MFGVADGAGCDPAGYADHHFTEAELSSQPQPDQHLHEHVRGRGLVMITSCGHGGIVNTVRRAKEVSGVDKFYALVGGFHLAPAPSLPREDHGRAEDARHRTHLPDAPLPFPGDVGFVPNAEIRHTQR